MTHPAWHPLFEAWASEPEVPRLPRGLVHKARDENVLVARVERTTEGRFATWLRVPTDHPFFFEHACDHVPGLLLVEAARQAGVAVAHLHHGVPRDGVSFLFRELSASFSAFAALDRPLFGLGEVTGLRRKGDRVTAMTYGGPVLQDGALVGTLSGTWQIVPSGVIERARR